MSSFECGDIADTDESPAQEDRPDPAFPKQGEYNSNDVLTGDDLSPKPARAEDTAIATVGATGNSIFALQRMELQN